MLGVAGGGADRSVGSAAGGPGSQCYIHLSPLKLDPIKGRGHPEGFRAEVDHQVQRISCWPDPLTPYPAPNPPCEPPATSLGRLRLVLWNPCPRGLQSQLPQISSVGAQAAPSRSCQSRRCPETTGEMWGEGLAPVLHSQTSPASCTIRGHQGLEKPV